MRSPMMQIFDAKERRERRIALLWTMFWGITLVAVLVSLAVVAVDKLPDPMSYSVTQEK